MKKMKEMKLHLATGLLLLTYYLIFNVIPDLDFTVALSDEIYYVFQVLLVLILGTVATIIFSKVNIGRVWSFPVSLVLPRCFLSFFFLIIRVGKSSNSYLSSYAKWQCSSGSSYQYDRS